MQRVVVSVRRRGEPVEADFEMPIDVAAADLAQRLARALGEPAGRGVFELRSVSLGRALAPDETLAAAGLWDGAMLVLASAADPVEATTRGLGGAGLGDAPDTQPSVAVPEPPALVLPAGEPAARPNLWLVVVSGVLLAAVGAAVWWFDQSQPRQTTTVVASQPAAQPTVVGAIEPTPRATTLAPTPSAAPPAPAPLAGQPVPDPGADEEVAWRDLQARLDLVWGIDWPASIALLQIFHSQYPTRVAATEKLYAALVEYGRALHDADATAAATDAWDQAVRMAPQRLEARAELAALAPTPIAVAEPAPAPVTPGPPPPRSATVADIAPAPTPLPLPPPAEETAPEPTAAACDVGSVEIACSPMPVPELDAAQPAATSVPQLVAVPPVIGRSASAANDRLLALGLEPRVQIADRFSPGGRGTVAAQDPPAGTGVPPGSSVSLLVASGEVAVPAVIGLPAQAAATLLHDAGLHVDTRHARRVGVEAGRAADVNPGVGVVLPTGATVVLTISQGP